MKCEECLPRIEEYVDAELDARTAARIQTHLSTCAACAADVAQLKREEEIYAHYRRDLLEVTPAHWEIVRARIEHEKETGIERPGARLTGRLREIFSPGKRFRPAAAYALLLILAGVTAGIIYLNNRGRRIETISTASKQSETPAAERGTQVLPPGKSGEGERTVPVVINREKRDSNRPSPALAATKGAPGSTGRQKTLAVAHLKPSQKPAATRPTPDATAQFELAVAGNVIDDAPSRSDAGDFDFEVARHAGRAELLLRSFRNMRLPDAKRSLDVSYEKEQSRKLLYRNIALRRDAAARGDQPTLELLNRLEPILLDIANLPGRARERDVRSIEQRMEKKEIIASLQVSTLVASN
jgi:hypothetical protein